MIGCCYSDHCERPIVGIARGQGNWLTFSPAGRSSPPSDPRWFGWHRSWRWPPMSSPQAVGSRAQISALAQQGNPQARLFRQSSQSLCYLGNQGTWSSSRSGSPQKPRHNEAHHNVCAPVNLRFPYYTHWRANPCFVRNPNNLAGPAVPGTREHPTRSPFPQFPHNSSPNPHPQYTYLYYLHIPSSLTVSLKLLLTLPHPQPPSLTSCDSPVPKPVMA